MTDISVVVPVYNESENITPLCEQLTSVLSKWGRKYEVVLVDDGSTDDSWQKLCESALRSPNLKLIRLRGNFGQTAAMSAGIHAATGKIIVTMDADLQNDPADIPKVVEHLEKSGCDVVSGWRKNRKDPFLTRRLPSMIANMIISRFTGVALHDYGCTLKAYRAEVIKDVHLYGEMHRFIPALARWVGGRVEEIEVNHHPRLRGKSKYGIGRTARVVLDLITVKFLLRYSKGPMQIFGRLGLWFGGIGTLMLLFMIAAHLSFLAFGTEFAAELVKRPFWIMTSFMLIFFGVQFIGMGLLAEIQIRTWYESQSKPIYVIREKAESRS